MRRSGCRSRSKGRARSSRRSRSTRSTRSTRSSRRSGRVRVGVGGVEVVGALGIGRMVLVVGVGAGVGVGAREGIGVGVGVDGGVGGVGAGVEVFVWVLLLQKWQQRHGSSKSPIQYHAARKLRDRRQAGGPQSVSREQHTIHLHRISEIPAMIMATQARPMATDSLTVPASITTTKHQHIYYNDDRRLNREKDTAYRTCKTQWKTL